MEPSASAAWPMMNIYFVKEQGKAKTEHFTQAFHIVNLSMKKIYEDNYQKQNQANCTF